MPDVRTTLALPAVLAARRKPARRNPCAGRRGRPVSSLHTRAPRGMACSRATKAGLRPARRARWPPRARRTPVGGPSAEHRLRARARLSDADDPSYDVGAGSAYTTTKKLEEGSKADEPVACNF